MWVNPPLPPSSCLSTLGHHAPARRWVPCAAVSIPGLVQELHLLRTLHNPGPAPGSLGDRWPLPMSVIPLSARAPSVRPPCMKCFALSLLNCLQEVSSGSSSHFLQDQAKP